MKKPANSDLEARDLGLARTIAANALRYARPLNEVLAGFIEKPLPARQGRVAAVLLAASVQLLVLRMPPHAVINLAVEQTRRCRHSTHLAKFVNAVLRKVSAMSEEFFNEADVVRSAVPDWLWQRWVAAYGLTRAREIAGASLREAPLDLTLKDFSQAALWADRLGAIRLVTGTLRLTDAGRIDELPGFGEGAWWVQDAAAALPARLLGDIQALHVADLCAAPGGKTFELAAAGAKVTAVDVSSTRLARLEENLKRLGLETESINADAAEWTPARTFDAVLLDAPCTATGTIRRHPDILHLKRDADIAALAELQARFLENAASLVRPCGLLVYCTCSLQPEEGEEQARGFLARHPDWEGVAIAVGEAGIAGAWITKEGFMRTLPCHTPPPAADVEESVSHLRGEGSRPLTGMDGFFAARFRRRQV